MTWSFEIEQDGIIVASGSAPNEQDAQREACHYAMMYAQDGPVKVRISSPKKAKKDKP